jgi:hypothetical protein
MREYFTPYNCARFVLKSITLRPTPANLDFPHISLTELVFVGSNKAELADVIGFNPSIAHSLRICRPGELIPPTGIQSISDGQRFLPESSKRVL